MSPGARPVVALTLPTGLRYEGRSLASSICVLAPATASSSASAGVNPASAVEVSLRSENAPGGGADRDRTGGLRLARAALSPLSYSPFTEAPRCARPLRRACRAPEGVVGLSGFEPLTSRLSAVRSSQLSYRPVVHEASRPSWTSDRY